MTNTRDTRNVDSLPARRKHCANCLRPQSTCICAWVTPVAQEVEVLILQHPLEVAQAKGSARLLHLSLPGSRLLTGETFGLALQAALHPPRRNILLYPDTPDSEAPEMDAHWLDDPASLRLVVLDGTWRKSSKMLHLNPVLRQMPRLSLSDMPASRYFIRKARLPDQLSTLEATCAVLAQLEGDGARVEPLLKAFDGFVAQQLARRPDSVAEVDQA